MRRVVRSAVIIATVRYRLTVMMAVVPGYEPNTYGEWEEQPDFRELPLSIEGTADHCINARKLIDFRSAVRCSGS